MSKIWIDFPIKGVTRTFPLSHDTDSVRSTYDPNSAYMAYGGIIEASKLTVTGQSTFKDDVVFEDPITVNEDLTVNHILYAANIRLFSLGSINTSSSYFDLQVRLFSFIRLDSVSNQVIFYTNIDCYDISAGNITCDSSVTANEVRLSAITTPPTNAAYGQIYMKSDSKLYFLTPGGTEYEICAKSPGTC